LTDGREAPFVDVDDHDVIARRFRVREPHKRVVYRVVKRRNGCGPPQGETGRDKHRDESTQQNQAVICCVRTLRCRQVGWLPYGDFDTAIARLRSLVGCLDQKVRFAKRCDVDRGRIEAGFREEIADTRGPLQP